MTNPSPAVVVPFRRIMNLGGYFFLAVPLLTLITYFTAGSKIAWSIGLGGIVPLVFFGVTVVAALWTAPKSPNFMAATVLVLSLSKMLTLVALLVIIRDAEFYDKAIFAITLLITAAATLSVQALVVSKSRVPTVDID